MESIEQSSHSQELLNEVLEYLRKLKESEKWCVVFFDLCNSVLIKQELEENVGNLMSKVHNNAVIKVVSEVSSKVEIWKLLGDGVLVGFKDVKDAILASINFALEFKSRAAPLRKYLEEKGLMEGLNFRVGMHWGPVYKNRYENVYLSKMGEIMIGKKGVGEVIDPLGSTVDLAHRVTAAAIPDTILITSNCLQECKEKRINKVNGWIDIPEAFESPFLNNWQNKSESFISPEIFFSLKGVKFPVGVHLIDWRLERKFPTQDLSDLDSIVNVLRGTNKDPDEMEENEIESIYLSISSVYRKMEEVYGLMSHKINNPFEEIYYIIRSFRAEFSWKKLWNGDIPFENESLIKVRTKLEDTRSDLEDTRYELYTSYSIFVNWFESNIKSLEINLEKMEELESYPAVQWVKLINLIKSNDRDWYPMIERIENKLFRDRDEKKGDAALWIGRISFLRVIRELVKENVDDIDELIKNAQNSFRYAKEANAPEINAMEKFINWLISGRLEKLKLESRMENQLRLIGLSVDLMDKIIKKEKVVDNTNL